MRSLMSPSTATGTASFSSVVTSCATSSKTDSKLCLMSSRVQAKDNSTLRCINRCTIWSGFVQGNRIDSSGSSTSCSLNSSSRAKRLGHTALKIVVHVVANHSKVGLVGARILLSGVFQLTTAIYDLHSFRGIIVLVSP